jgi:hypothetical protein
MSHTFFRKSIGVLLVLFIALAEVSPARSADGSLDLTFGDEGTDSIQLGQRGKNDDD